MQKPIVNRIIQLVSQLLAHINFNLSSYEKCVYVCLLAARKQCDHAPWNNRVVKVVESIAVLKTETDDDDRRRQQGPPVNTLQITSFLPTTLTHSANASGQTCAQSMLRNTRTECQSFRTVSHQIHRNQSLTHWLANRFLRLLSPINPPAIEMDELRRVAEATIRIISLDASGGDSLRQCACT